MRNGLQGACNKVFALTAQGAAAVGAEVTQFTAAIPNGYRGCCGHIDMLQCDTLIARSGIACVDKFCDMGKVRLQRLNVALAESATGAIGIDKVNDQSVPCFRFNMRLRDLFAVEVGKIIFECIDMTELVPPQRKRTGCQPYPQNANGQQLSFVVLVQSYQYVTIVLKPSFISLVHKTNWLHVIIELFAGEGW